MIVHYGLPVFYYFVIFFSILYAHTKGNPNIFTYASVALILLGWILMEYAWEFPFCYSRNGQGYLCFLLVVCFVNFMCAIPSPQNADNYLWWDYMLISIFCPLLAWRSDHNFRRCELDFSAICIPDHSVSLFGMSALQYSFRQ